MLTCTQLSAIPTIRHGFFTRKGGASSGIYSSLNCGIGSGDDRALVLKNRATAASMLTAEANKLCLPTQVHSAKAIIVEAPWSADNQPEGDALVTATPGIAVGVLTADCLPILLCDPKAAVVAAVHAGWKGALGGVIEAALTAMASLGAHPADMICAIGPVIAQPSYEVGPEFYERFHQEDPHNDMYFLPSRQQRHFLFDLPGYAKDRLADAGIKAINILAHDTCLDEDNFYSFRRATLRKEAAYGRQLSAIMIKSPRPLGGEGE